MPFPSGNNIRQAINATGVTAVSGAAPQVVNGVTHSLAAKRVEIGTLAAKVTYTVTTNLLTLTAKWQSSDDAGATWRDCLLPNAAANVAFVTGTGVLQTATIFIAAPDSAYPHFNVRLVITSGAAAGGGLGVDEVNVSYQYLESSG